MQTIRFSGRKPSPETIEIGQETDSNAEVLRFLLPTIADGQIATLQMILPDGTADVLNITDGQTVIPASIMEIPGTARAWVEILGTNALAWHSEIIYMGIGDTPEISDRTEQQYPTALQEAIYRTETAQAVAEAAAAMAAASSGQATFSLSSAGHLIVTWTDTDGTSHDTDIGAVSAYAVAVKNGYTGTEAQWETYIATASINAAAAAADALKAEGYAVGTQNGTDVESGSDYYQNNAKYYNTQAQSAKTAAQEAAGTAAAAYGTDLLAEDYDTETGATAGKYYIHSGDLYLCTADATGAWDSTKFKQVDVGGQLGDLKSAVDYVAAGEMTLDLEDYHDTHTNCTIQSDNTVTRSGMHYVSAQVPIDDTWNALTITANSERNSYVSFVTELIPVAPTPGDSIADILATGETGRHTITAGTGDTLIIPEDAAYAVISLTSDDYDITPSAVAACTKTRKDIEELQGDVEDLQAAVDGYIPDAVQASAGFMMATFVPGYEATPDVGSASSHNDSAKYISAKIPATTTDYVEFCGEGGTSTQRYYAILDADSKVLYRSAAGQSGVITPNMSNYPTAAYVVVNVKKSYTGKTYLFVGKSVLARLAEKQDALTFDNDPNAGSANPVKSSGVFNAEKKIVSNFGCLFSNFIQKNVNATNGKITSTGAENTITHNMLIPIEKIFAATSDDANISLYLYNSDGEYLGTTAGNPQPFVGDSAISSALTTFPTAKYARVRFGNSTKPVTTSDYLTKGVSLLLTENYDLIKGNVVFDTIARYGENGVFTPSGESDLDFIVTVPFNGDTRNQIYTCIAKYEQSEGITAVPTIIFRYGNTLDRTTEYILANKGNFETKQWRVIRYPGTTTALSILFHIPVGVTVTIKDFFNTYTDEVSRTPYGIRFNGHQKYLPSLMNPDTLPGVMMAVKCGACAMIQIPKRLSDGTWIFYHDDSLVYNDTYIRQADGTELPSTYNGTLWSAIDFDTANSWDWGISKNAMFTGTKPMTMEQFFNICGKTGIMPMLSIHPWPSSAELGEIKTIAKKCGVLNQLGIKCSASHISEAYAVFGNDIESYTVDVSSGTQTTSVVNAAISAMDGLSGCTVRRVIELFASTAYNAYFGESTYDPFKLIADAGYDCALAMQTGKYHPTLPNGNSAILKGTDIEYWQNKGVSEYTYEYDWSNGLNW